MSDQQRSTSDILAQIRGGAAKAPQAAKASEEEVTPAPESEAPVAAKPPAPKGTSDILAAIKAGGAGAKAGAGASAAQGSSEKPAAAPSGTSSILASIRGGGAPAAKPAGKAAKAAPKAAVDTKKAAGMSAAEMIQAARKGVVAKDPETGEPAVPAKPLALPKKPLVKPTPAAAKPKAADVTRRSALSTLVSVVCSPIVVAWTSLVTATAVSSLAMARFMMPNVLVEPPTKFKIGPPTDYGAGTVSTKWKAQFGVWVVNDEVDGEQMVYALSTVCTHLGCTPNWLEGEQKFKCPCHGSGFYKTGVNFEGPAPRPLERYGIRLAEDGMLEVDKSVKFQKELGQWENAASFVPA